MSTFSAKMCRTGSEKMISMSFVRPMYRKDILEWPADYLSFLETNRRVTKESVDALNLGRGQKIIIWSALCQYDGLTEYLGHDDRRISTCFADSVYAYEFNELFKINPLFSLAEAANHLDVRTSTLKACYYGETVHFGRGSKELPVDSFTSDDDVYLTKESIERLKHELSRIGKITPEFHSRLVEKITGMLG